MYKEKYINKKQYTECMDKDISKLLSESEIDSLFDLNKILININKIFERLELNE